ncbi:unnamed protein product [Linum trigynum]|uniref:Secreted protein n=1 Tax=Linum trigynum TaxID=586398 RepID=A0AAV2CLG7_9ROSI
MSLRKLEISFLFLLLRDQLQGMLIQGDPALNLHRRLDLFRGLCIVMAYFVRNYRRMGLRLLMHMVKFWTGTWQG